MHVLGPRAARSLLSELSLTRWGAASRSSLASASGSRKLASLQRALRRRPSPYAEEKANHKPSVLAAAVPCTDEILGLTAHPAQLIELASHRLNDALDVNRREFLKNVAFEFVTKHILR